ncbi:HVO_0758 family zinc finger protein [Halorussus amylolyticus]|uniref:HVO_0758 family zinc finger protein n=1 Tax=Halorussus amylolyticus TaxID=1126242 RepID=UPI00192FA561|nr:HVO_0758 family zinc finger protein [Halorussus amylolyticus]
MKSIRRGLRAGEVEKDTYGRLSCAECGQSLSTRDDEDVVGKVKSCPGCGSEWKDL